MKSNNLYIKVFNKHITKPYILSTRCNELEKAKEQVARYNAVKVIEAYFVDSNKQKHIIK